MPTTVCILKDWDWPDLLRQTPGRAGMWDGLQFVTGPVEACDYAIVLNHPAADTTLRCPPHHVWAIMQEPPNEYHGSGHRGDRSYARVYTTHPGLRGKRYVHSQPALPWHVNRDYDYLVGCRVPAKEKRLSWITSNIAVWAGHRARLQFLEKIHGAVDFDLYGRGFNYIEDKWDALAPYCYSIAVENWRGPHYWSEKLADCFLAWSMPIYYGCTRITDFFPVEALVQIDIADPDVIERIRETVQGDLWHKNRDAIAYARQLVLESHQFFPFVAQRIRQHERTDRGTAHRYAKVSVPCQPRGNAGPLVRLRRVVGRLAPGWLRRSLRQFTEWLQ